jgi:hypothetical protein
VSTAQPLSLASAALTRVPDFFIVGPHKSGTTALHAMLRAHPQVFMPEFKEPRFFATDMRPRFQSPREPRYPETLDEYLSLFTAAKPEQRVGEASASYMWSHTAAGRIAALQPNARIITILREPASFLHSLHVTFVRIHIESERDLGRAIAREPERREGRHVPRRSHLPQLLQYSEHVRYLDQLQRYHSHFPPEQVLVLIYDDFRSDNERTIRRILRFLDVDHDLPLETFERHVTKRTVRSQAAEDVAYSMSMGDGTVSRLAKTAVKAVTTRRMRRGALTAARRHIVIKDAPPPDERLMAELRHRFKPEVVALSEYMDRDLVALWGYDDVA